MLVEQEGIRGRFKVQATIVQLFPPDLGGGGHAPGQAQDGVILALDFHLQNFVCRLVRNDFFVCQEGDEPVLKGKKTPLDFALGLRGWGDQMGDSEPFERPLELAFGVLVIVRAAQTEKAQCVGVNRFGQAVGFECTAKMAKVVPCGFGRNETPAD